MILVIGATGTIGQEVVRQLVELGQPVRVLLRNAARASILQDLPVEVVQADLGVPETLPAAFHKIEKVFLLAANTPNQVTYETNAIDAACAAGVDHLVKLSIIGPSADAPLALARWHYAIEQHLAASGIPATILRPGYFMQNLLQFAHWITPDGGLPLPMGSGAMSMIDARDIAAVAATVLVQKGHVGRQYTITGAEAITMHRVAQELSVATGRTITYIDSDRESFLQAYLADGNEEGYANDIAILYDVVVRAGYVATVTSDFESVTGKLPRFFSDFARDYADAFRR